MKYSPLVSIGMPVFNPDDSFRIAVKSLIFQDFKNWELLIINDGSTTNVSELISDILDSRIKIFQYEENLGLAIRLNECIDRSKGVYFARMDADDISYPSRLSKQVAFLEKNHSIDLIATKSLVIDGADRPVGALPIALDHETLVSQPWRGICMPHPTWVGRLDWFRKNRYQVPSPYRSEDQELLLRASHLSQYATIDEILFAYRIKSHLDFNMLAKTRLATLNFQSRYFLAHREYGNLFMSFVAYIAKKIADMFLSRGGALGYLRYAPISAAELERWRLFCNQLRS